MKIAIGNDHAATQMKFDIVAYLEKQGHEVVNFGTDSNDSVDYPDIAEKVAVKVASGDCDKGILICGTGIGMSIAANKVNGIRAACCSDPLCVRLTRQHNNANVLCFGARIVGQIMAEEMVDIFLNTDYMGDRHEKRVQMIAEIETRN